MLQIDITYLHPMLNVRVTDSFTKDAVSMTPPPSGVPDNGLRIRATQQLPPSQSSQPPQMQFPPPSSYNMDFKEPDRREYAEDYTRASRPRRSSTGRNDRAQPPPPNMTAPDLRMFANPNKLRTIEEGVGGAGGDQYPDGGNMMGGMMGGGGGGNMSGDESMSDHGSDCSTCPSGSDSYDEFGPRPRGSRRGPPSFESMQQQQQQQGGGMGGFPSPQQPMAPFTPNSSSYEQPGGYSMYQMPNDIAIRTALFLKLERLQKRLKMNVTVPPKITTGELQEVVPKS